jgi:hypothetical protein
VVLPTGDVGEDAAVAAETRIEAAVRAVTEEGKPVIAATVVFFIPPRDDDLAIRLQRERLGVHDAASRVPCEHLAIDAEGRVERAVAEATRRTTARTRRDWRRAAPPRADLQYPKLGA